MSLDHICICMSHIVMCLQSSS